MLGEGSQTQVVWGVGFHFYAVRSIGNCTEAESGGACEEGVGLLWVWASSHEDGTALQVGSGDGCTVPWMCCQLWQVFGRAGELLSIPASCSLHPARQQAITPVAESLLPIWETQIWRDPALAIVGIWEVNLCT